MTQKNTTVMTATLVGVTVPVNLDEFNRDWAKDIITTDAQFLAEAVGRLCYRSWSRPNPDTATNKGYLRNILRQRHFSVLEHLSASFLIRGISRSCSQQFERHRHLSPSELSQRFVNVEEARMVTHPSLSPEMVDSITDLVSDARRTYQDLVDRLMAKGLLRKQAREAARGVMPIMTETELVMSGNVRAWREMIAKRATVHADREIRALAVEIGTQLSELWPHAFQDMHYHTPDGLGAFWFDKEDDE